MDPMSAVTWDTLREFLATQYRLLRSEPHAIELRFEQPETGEIQDLRVERVQLFGEPWLLLRADLGTQSWSPQTCLERNAGWPGLALVLLGDRFVLQSAMPLRITDPAELNRALRFMAHQAMLLRMHGVTEIPTAASDALSHWA